MEVGGSLPRSARKALQMMPLFAVARTRAEPLEARNPKRLRLARDGAGEEAMGAPLEAADGDGEPMPDELTRVPPLPDRERREQDAADGVRKAGGAALRDLEQAVTAAQEVRETGLVRGLRELAVRRPAVPDDDAAVAGPEDRGGLRIAAAGLDRVDGDVAGHEHPEPPEPPADLPARLVRRDHGAAPHGRDQRVVR